MNGGIFKRYWKGYGGIKALITSPYLWASILITLLFYPHWSQPLWWDDVLSIMPNLLGFSLGGYAMWIAIGDDNFRKLISGEDSDGEPSPYMEVNSAFVHFIILQILSMLLALFAKSYNFALPPTHWLVELLGNGIRPAIAAWYCLSYLIFIYALVSALAATMALLRVSSWYDMHQTNQKAKEKEAKINNG